MVAVCEQRSVSRAQHAADSFFGLEGPVRKGTVHKVLRFQKISPFNLSFPCMHPNVKLAQAEKTLHNKMAHC